MNDSQNQNWLVRPTTIKLLWRVFIAILALTVLAQLVIKVKGYFGVDDWFGFAAAFGFLSCVAMVLLAKVVESIEYNNPKAKLNQMEDCLEYVIDSPKLKKTLYINKYY